MDEAYKLGELLASGPPLVYAAIKEVVREAENMKFQDALNKITNSQFESVESFTDQRIKLRVHAHLPKNVSLNGKGVS